MSLYEKTRVRENLYFDILYAVLVTPFAYAATEDQVTKENFYNHSIFQVLMTINNVHFEKDMVTAIYERHKNTTNAKKIIKKIASESKTKTLSF